MQLQQMPQPAGLSPAEKRTTSSSRLPRSTFRRNNSRGRTPVLLIISTPRCAWLGRPIMHVHSWPLYTYIHVILTSWSMLHALWSRAVLFNCGIDYMYIQREQRAGARPSPALGATVATPHCFHHHTARAARRPPFPPRGSSRH